MEFLHGQDPKQTWVDTRSDGSHVFQFSHKMIKKCRSRAWFASPQLQMPSLEAIHWQLELDSGRIKSSHSEIPALESGRDADMHLVTVA